MAADLSLSKAAKFLIAISILRRRPVRVAKVLENTKEGKIVERALNVRDVEQGKRDCPEVVLMDEETGQEILNQLKIYRNTSLYIAVMVTVMFIIFMFDTFG